MSQAEFEMVVLSDDWNGLPFSCKHLLKHFLPEIRLVWVETIGLRSPRFSVYDLRRAASKIVDWLTPAARGESSTLPRNLMLVKPVQIPYNQWSPVRELNRQLIVRRIRKALGSSKRVPRVFLSTWPFVGNLVGMLEEDLSVYYRVDDFSEFPGVDKSAVMRWEHEFIERADLIVASSEHLMRMQTPPDKSRYLPHGVDFAHFSRTPVDSKVPPMLSGLARPVIGFFGSLDKWVDLKCMAAVARERPDWTFAFIGPSQLPASELPRLPNLIYCGPVPYAELPEVACHFDVGLIPFKVNELTAAVNPLKLMEYMALGLPVVSSPLPEVVKFSQHVQLAMTKDEYIAAIEAALADRGVEARTARRALAESMSWQSQAKKLRGWIESELGQRRKWEPDSAPLGAPTC